MLLFRNLRGLKACLLGCVGVICLISGSAKADVCFLPNGGCVALDSLGSTGGADENCSGYGTEIKGQGWDCSDTCSAHGHIYYHCVEKSCGTGYQPGVSSCPRGYTHEYEKKTDGEGNETFVYSGYSKCGKCQAPEECPIGTQKSSKCEDEGYKARETQYYVGTNVCYICLDDNCKGGKKKYCSWSSGSKNGPSGSNRATSDEWYTSTALTQYGSTCYACCNNKCRRGSQEVTSCNANTELLRTLEYTACGSACNECCNNVCSSGSLNVTSCSSGHYMTTDYTTECGNSCNSCHDCGGYRESEKPTGCYNCIPRQCGGETRYDCTKLSNTCSVGSTSSSCAAGYKAIANGETTECGNTCYSCECDDVTLFKTKQKCQTAADGTIYICSFNANRTCYKRDRLKCDPADGLYATKELCEKTLQVSWLDLFEKSLEEFSIISASYASPNLDVHIDDDPVLAEVDPTCEQCLGWFECNPLTQKSIGAANGWSGGTEYFGERIITRAKCNDMCGYEIPTICSDEHGDDDDDDPVVDDEYECVSNADECWYKRKKCSPLDDETPDTSTCKTTSYFCSDGCYATRTCYKYACSDGQKCQNGACVNCVCPGNSKHDNELTCSGNYTKTSVAPDNCGKPCYDCVCQLSCGTNQTLDSNTCTCVCKPKASETPDTSTCKTMPYACDDGCGGTRTCYKYACNSETQTCQNGTCVNKCSPLSDETPDTNTCKTISYGCDDGCGGTRTCYKSACGDNQTCQNGTCVDNDNSCPKFTYFWVETLYSGNNANLAYTVSVSGASEDYDSPWEDTIHGYKVCKDDNITISVNDNKLCNLTVNNWYFGGYGEGNGQYGSGKSISFKVTDDFVNKYLADVGWLTSEDESQIWVQSAEPTVTYVGYKTQGDCTSDTGKSCVKDSNNCYVPNTYATIYCDYNDILATGSGLWGDSPWHRNCDSTDAFYIPCEVDYLVNAISGTTTIDVCRGASYGSGPTQIPAGTYQLNTSYLGILGLVNNNHTHLGWDDKTDLVYKYWVPDVMIVFDKSSSSNFKCVDLTHFGSNESACSISNQVNIASELGYAGLSDWVDYTDLNKNVTCPAVSSNQMNYTFEAGKSYYIRVGKSGSHTEVASPYSAYGCGYSHN